MRFKVLVRLVFQIEASKQLSVLLLIKILIASFAVSVWQYAQQELLQERRGLRKEGRISKGLILFVPTAAVAVILLFMSEEMR